MGRWDGSRCRSSCDIQRSCGLLARLRVIIVTLNTGAGSHWIPVLIGIVGPLLGLLLLGLLQLLVEHQLLVRRRGLSTDK